MRSICGLVLYWHISLGEAKTSSHPEWRGTRLPVENVSLPLSPRTVRPTTRTSPVPHRNTSSFSTPSSSKSTAVPTTTSKTTTTTTTTFQPNDMTLTWAVMGAGLGTALVLGCLCAWSVWGWRARQSRRDKTLLLQRSRIRQMEEELGRAKQHRVEMNDYRDLSLREPRPEPGSSGDAWEIARDALQIHTFDVLGRGEFGQVYKAILIRQPRQPASIRTRVQGSAPITLVKTETEAAGHELVAAKVLSPTAKHSEMESFRTEMGLMKELGTHPHIVRLVGCVTLTRPLVLVVELCADGNLLGVLRRNRPDKDDGLPKLSLQQLYSFAWQVADGMEYVASKGFIHRDVAARNVLISSGVTAKVSDFGLSRHVDAHDASYSFTTGRLPVKWMAIESLRDNLATKEGDVWMFGVLLWEIVSLGQAPYQLVAPGHMLAFLERGNRLVQPKGCPDQYYEIMRSCWEREASARPDFAALKASLSALLEARTADEYNYVDLLASQYSYFDLAEVHKEPAAEETAKNSEVETASPVAQRPPSIRDRRRPMAPPRAARKQVSLPPADSAKAKEPEATAYQASVQRGGASEPRPEAAEEKTEEMNAASPWGEALPVDHSDFMAQFNPPDIHVTSF